MSEFTYLKRGSARFVQDVSDSEEEEFGDDIFKKINVSSSSLKQNDIFKKMKVGSSCGEQESSPESIGRQCMEDSIALAILESTSRSLGLLMTTEEIAVSTTKELYGQREQLQRTEKNLNNVNSSLKQNGKQLNVLKSPFGALKNFIISKRELFRNRNHDQPQVFPEVSKSLVSGEVRFSRGHPGLRARGIADEPSVSFGESSLELKKKLNENMDEINVCVARLKELAIHMGEEVDLQNKLLDNISGKTENAITTMHHQNRIVTKILK